MRVLIADDEPLARDVLRFLLADEQDALVVGECEDGDQAVAAIRKERPDLLLLDVQMPGRTGIDVLRELESLPPAIILVTAFDQHAIEAFELRAIDYLLKPLEQARFQAALQRAREQLALREIGKQAVRFQDLLAGWAKAPSRPTDVPQSRLEHDRLLVRRRNRIAVVPLDELDWIESAGDYVYLHCGARKHLLRQTLGHLQGQLDPRIFRRIHRQTLVNLERISEIRYASHGELQLVLVDGTVLKVSRTCRGSLADFLGESK